MVSDTGVEQESILYDKPTCQSANGRLGGYVYDLAFDVSGRLHAIALDRNFVYDRGKWQEDPGEPCEKYSQGSGALACSFTVGAKDIGVSTDAKQITGWLLFAFLTAGRGRYGEMWDENRPRRIAIAKLGDSGWGDITVLEPDNADAGDMVGREAILVSDSQNRLRIFFKGRYIDDLAASITGEGQLKRAMADGKEIALSVRKAVGTTAVGLGRGFINTSSSFSRQFAVDPVSGRTMGLSERIASTGRAALFGTVEVHAVQSQLGEAGKFETPQEIFAFNSGLLSVPSPALGPGGRFQFAVPVVSADTSNTCTYEIRYYVWEPQQWRAPLTLESDIKKNEACWRFGAIQALPPLGPKIASSASGRSFVAWSSNNGVAGRWIDFRDISLGIP